MRSHIDDLVASLPRHGQPEVLNWEQVEELQEKLSEIGPWVLRSGAQGTLHATRAGTTRWEQSSLTSRGLLQAVAEQEARIEAQGERPTATTEGVVGTDTKEEER